MLQKFNPKNENIQIWVGDQLYPRNEAKISVFDSAVQGGDAVWEGLRVYQEGLFCLEAHLDRLLASAHTLMFEDIPNKNTIRKAIKQTLEANAMTCDTHIRLTLTRGSKITSGMDPRLNQSGSKLIVLAEWKPPVYNNDKGITVITSSVRRNSPMHLDSKIHHNNLLNNILAKIEANHAGVDAALMLDNQGFLAELNGTNIFLIKNQKIRTPLTHACLPRITRNLVLQLLKLMSSLLLKKTYHCLKLTMQMKFLLQGLWVNLRLLRKLMAEKLLIKTTLICLMISVIYLIIASLKTVHQ